MIFETRHVEDNAGVNDSFHIALERDSWTAVVDIIAAITPQTEVMLMKY